MNYWKCVCWHLPVNVMDSFEGVINVSDDQAEAELDNRTSRCGITVLQAFEIPHQHLLHCYVL